MREIKFRGRDSSGKWHYGCLVTNGHYAEIITHPYTAKSEWKQVDPATIGQYIGAKDCNGTEIYEDDILGIDHGGIVENTTDVYRWWVRWRDAVQINYLKPSKVDELTKKIKVIGNIHDNSALLEGGEK